MSKCLGRLVVCAILLAGFSGAAAAAASAYGTSDLSWALSETTITYPSQYHVTSDNPSGAIDYRWLDADMTKTTVISANGCGDLSLLGKSTFGGGDTSYHTLANTWLGNCFYLRGRTTGGSTITHDGRVRR